MESDIYRKRVVLARPGMERVEARRDVVYREVEGTRLTLDVFLPPAGDNARGQRASQSNRVEGPLAAPAVLLIHGGPVPPQAHGVMKNMGVFQSYGELLAASGLVAVACNHFHRGWHDFEGSADNIAAALSWLRGNAAELGLDPERLALWAFSGGGVQLAPALRSPSPWVRCLVAFYALLDLRPVSSGTSLGELPAEAVERFSPAACLEAAAAEEASAAHSALPPLLVARAGRDGAWLNESLDGFVRAALAAGVEIELLNHAQGQHGFDILDDVPRSREIIARAIEFIRWHTGGSGTASD